MDSDELCQFERGEGLLVRICPSPPRVRSGPEIGHIRSVNGCAASSTGQTLRRNPGIPRLTSFQKLDPHVSGRPHEGDLHAWAQVSGFGGELRSLGLQVLGGLRHIVYPEPEVI